MMYYFHSPINLAKFFFFFNMAVSGKFINDTNILETVSAF